MPSISTSSGHRWANIIENLKIKIKNNRNLILVCFIATFAWGLIAHAYIFLHSSFTHDSLNEFIGYNDWKVQLGRIFVPIYRDITRHSVTLPWLIGLLSLLFIFIAVFFAVKIFNLKSNSQIVLIAGIFTANMTVIATAATYIGDLDCNMLGLAFAVCAVYLWKRYNKGFLWGIIFVALSLGLYQSYISVSITLILLCLIFELLNSLPFRKALLKALKGVAMLIGGGILYFLAVIIACSLTGITLVSDTANSLTGMFSLSLVDILNNLLNGYAETVKSVISPVSLFSNRTMMILSIVTIGIAFVILLIGLFQKTVHWKEKISIVVLILLLPIGMNTAYILTNGYSNDVMYYALWLIYLLVLLLAWWQVDTFRWIKPILGRGVQVVMAGLICVVLLLNVQTSNAVYLQKDLIEQGTLSLFTRIVDKMEDYDGYISGETQVVFVGDINTQLEKIPGLENTYNITGALCTSALGAASTRDYYRHYFEYILLDSAVMADNYTWSEMQTNEQVEEMPYFPAEGSMSMIDGILIIKVGPPTIF